MIIEIFGLPGAGKTTLAKTIKATTSYPVISVRSRTWLIVYNLGYLVRHPINYFVSFWYIVTNSPTLHIFYYKFMNFFMQPNARYQQSRSLAGAVVDQGYLQNVLSVFERPLTKESLHEYLRYVQLPGKVVVLDTPLSTRQEFIRRRGYGPRERFEQAYVMKWQASTEENFKLFLSELPHLHIPHLIISSPVTPEMEEKLEKFL